MTTFLNFLSAGILASTPLLLGTLGEILTEKSGNLNLGVEGIMFIGGISGLSGIYYYQQTTQGEPLALICILIGLFCAFLGASLGAFLFSFITITLRANQTVTGIALTIFGVGIGNFFGELLTKSTSQNYLSVNKISKEAFNQGIPFLSELSYVGKILFSYNFMVYLAIILALLMSYFLKKTKAGLNLKAVGENPLVAYANGINITKYKYLATCLGGGICGLGGLYLVMNSTTGTGGVWVHNCLSGFGWLSVALVIFSTWNPLKAIICSFIFGSLSVIRYYYPLSFIPSTIYDILPYIVTVLVLILVSLKNKSENQPPGSLGNNYFREEK